MPKYTVKYEVVLESSILVDVKDEDAAEVIVERMVRGGQHLAPATDFEVLDVVKHDADPHGDW